MLNLLGVALDVFQIANRTLGSRAGNAKMRVQEPFFVVRILAEVEVDVDARVRR